MEMKRLSSYSSLFDLLAMKSISVFLERKEYFVLARTKRDCLYLTAIRQPANSSSSLASHISKSASVLILQGLCLKKEEEGFGLIRLLIPVLCLVRFFFLKRRRGFQSSLCRSFVYRGFPPNELFSVWSHFVYSDPHYPKTWPTEHRPRLSPKTEWSEVPKTAFYTLATASLNWKRGYLLGYEAELLGYENISASFRARPIHLLLLYFMASLGC